MQKFLEKKIVKKVHQVGASMVITIDPTIVKKFNINELTYLSQEVIEDGFLMKIKKII
jgi:hypothetical protein